MLRRFKHLQKPISEFADCVFILQWCIDFLLMTVHEQIMQFNSTMLGFSACDDIYR
jgi:hypothetical protein